MRALAPLALAATMSGCFTTWVGIRAAGYPGAMDENVREERVPLPGIDEKLVVSLSIPSVTPSGVSLQCRAEQHGRDAMYRAAYRYGRRWKTTTAIMFVTEALVSGALYLSAKAPDTDPNYWPKLVGAGFFAVDALGTGALILAPRKELFSRTEIAVTTPTRSVCPDGVMLEIAGDTYPVNASGGLGELGTAALDQWMQQPTGSLVLSFAGASAMLAVSDGDRCAYQRQRATSPAAPGTPGGAYCPAQPGLIAAVLDIPVGTLGPVAAAP